MDDPERPGSDADAAKIAEWMEEDFGRAVADGIDHASGEDEHEVVEVEIINHERDEVVGTIDTDGNLRTESESLRHVSAEYLEDGVPVLVPTTMRTRMARRFTPMLRWWSNREPRDSFGRSLTNSRVRSIAIWIPLMSFLCSHKYDRITA